MAKSGVKRRIPKWQLSPVGCDQDKISAFHRGSITTGNGQAVLIDIDANDATTWHRLPQTQGDRRLTAPAIEDDHVRTEVRK
jgi:hypothetical protein